MVVWVYGKARLMVNLVYWQDLVQGLIHGKAWFQGRGQKNFLKLPFNKN
jgi:hypothetical protein